MEASEATMMQAVARTGMMLFYIFLISYIFIIIFNILLN